MFKLLQQLNLQTDWLTKTSVALGTAVSLLTGLDVLKGIFGLIVSFLTILVLVPQVMKAWKFWKDDKDS